MMIMRICEDCIELFHGLEPNISTATPVSAAITAAAAAVVVVLYCCCCHPGVFH